MTVYELRERLAEFDPAMRVALGWDMGYAKPGAIDVEEIGDEKILVIDCSEYGSF